MGAGWGFDSDKLLARMASALERQAAAEERRNDILEREMIERRETWAASEARSAEALAAILQPQTQAAADPWRDLPESRR